MTIGSGIIIPRLFHFVQSAEQNELCNFGRGHYGKRLYKIILNSDKYFNQKMSFKGGSKIKILTANRIFN